MKKYIKAIIDVIKLSKLNPIIIYKIYQDYTNDYSRFKAELRENPDFVFGKKYPKLIERYQSCGTMSGDYFHQDLLVARRIFENNPARHVDIGSRTDGFVAHVASFREIEIYDIRPQESTVKNIIYKQADFINLPDELINSCSSISSLHAIEHFGLGRYGDPIDVNGHLKAINNIYNMLIPGGKFYFSGPIGPQRIEFNAHRVYSIGYLLNLFKDKFQIDVFSYVDDDGVLHENVELSPKKIENNYNCHYGCGIFELTKKNPTTMD